MLRARGLVKRYGDTLAVEGVDLEVQPGQFHGLLGRNGAGKTTVLQMLTGLVRPDEGTVQHDGTVAGFTEAPRFYPFLSGTETLALLARLDGGDATTRVAPSLAAVGLTDRAGDRVGGYSLGMRQRLAVAAALLPDPAVLVLDEPGNGLDPAGRDDLHVLLRGLADRGCAVLLSSHDLTEVDHLCDAVTVLRRGRVAWSGTMAGLREAAPTQAYDVHTSDDAVARTVQVPGAHLTTGPAETERAVGATDRTGLCLHAAPTALDGWVLQLAARGVAVRLLAPRHGAVAALFAELTADDPPLAERTADRPGAAS